MSKINLRNSQNIMPSYNDSQIRLNFRLLYLEIIKLESQRLFRKVNVNIIVEYTTYIAYNFCCTLFLLHTYLYPNIGLNVHCLLKSLSMDSTAVV